MSQSTPPLRRGFFKNSILTAGAAWFASGIRPAQAKPVRPKAQRLPREVWIATLTTERLSASTQATMVKRVIEMMTEIVPHEPDVICLPETFAVANLSKSPAELRKRAEASHEIIEPIAEFARKHACHVVCPIHTMEGSRIYNSAVFVGRRGEVIGSYHKAHPTTSELDAGISPGPLEPPVFRTDIGLVSAQICFDIEWQDTWQSLSQGGVEIIFWPSAFAGGQMVNAKAWQQQACVVSSTLKDTAKICDVSGQELARTSRWNRWVCAAVNLEKEFLHTWPYVQRFPEIEAKYGRDVQISNFGEEEWSILESRSPDVRIADVMQEFELRSIRQHLQDADARQRASR